MEQLLPTYAEYIAQQGQLKQYDCDTSVYPTSVKHGNNFIKGFSSFGIELTNLRTSIKVDDIGKIDVEFDADIGGVYRHFVIPITSSYIEIKSEEGGFKEYYPITLTGVAPDDYSDMPIGTYYVYLTLYNADNIGFTLIATDQETGEALTITLEEPMWEEEFTVSSPPPVIMGGKAHIDSLKVYKWDEDLEDWDGYDTFYAPVVPTEIGTSSWKFKYAFAPQYVDDTSSDSAGVKIDLEYKYTTGDEKEYRQAFFSTTRNQNYSNGIWNSVFVGGVSGYSNFSSRTWWSQVNDPLYFPDTNYAEVGSNDTAIVGLTKVGDYLAAVKQSKTTDTAIYLLYPTSFEENTTFAIKQGVQGVGALGKYTFNILGDETLFLSPNGVMAIVPTQDEEHKVQNRSYFIDKRLLAEKNIADAFSFVYDGKYYISMGANGHCYVLDGNQRNSWGNDKTNLVYECYYLENVPAKCFAKFDNTLIFSDGMNICEFTNGYTDAYNTADEDVPVMAEWSTVFDDDGSIHYYKTMQKKGNVVSILPKEKERPYVVATPTQEEYEADPTKYFVKQLDKYKKCTTEAYDATQTYYVENRSNTKVYVKKDDKPLMLIERQFGLSSDIPSEMYLRKKFKKYKRLQFIIRNYAAEPFGVDSIIKNYTLGNYAKK